MFFLILAKNTFAVEKNSFFVSTSHPAASKIGGNILAKGGNAMDAVLAIQMALNLLEPESSGIGGGGFLLYYDKKKNHLTFYDGRETAPSKIKKEFFLDNEGNPLSFFDIEVGGSAVGLPGLLSMREIAHNDHGLLNWKDLFTPTIKLSENGFKVSSKLHKAIEKDKYLYLFPESKKYFYKNNLPKKKQSMQKNSNFTETLKIISLEKSKGFYQGKIAESIVYAVQNSPIKRGYISLNDLKNYKA